MAAITTLDENTFMEQIGSSDVPVIVDFWAEWCAPCKKIAPILEELAEDYGDKVQISKLNVDENSTIARQYSVMSIPTLLVFKDGEVVGTLVGNKSKEKLQEDFAEFI